MRLSRISPHQLLAPYIEKMWVFESETGIPADDMRTKVPDGLLKMLICHRGSITASRNGALIRSYPEGSIYVAGQMERPVTIDSSGPTGAIGIEFKPSAAYRFFPFSLKEIKNTVILANEALDRRFCEVQARIAEERAVDAKLALIQAHLISILTSSDRTDPLVEWAVGAIHRSGGLASIRDLCEKSGYSKRHLDQRFSDRVGVGPKVLARIIRFLPLFRSYLAHGAHGAPRDGIPAHYYDQSHFIWEFRKFTGMSPGDYLRSSNDFGEIFHRDT